jgi:hypothetical protein
MKYKVLPILFTLAALLIANQASAYYSPSTGRWLSRDPNGDPGFELLRASSAVPKVGQIASAAYLPPSRLFVRDTVESKREPNRYDFVANTPISAVDLFGLRTIHVGNCQVIVAYGHGSTGSPHHFKFDGPCSAGWFLGCYSKETDDLLQYPHNIPGAASISDEYDFSFDGTERLNRDFKTTWDAALVKAVKMCKLCKCICPKITVKAVKIDNDPTLPWYGDDYPDATILCQ